LHDLKLLEIWSFLWHVVVPVYQEVHLGIFHYLVLGVDEQQLL
jgi:hypothetical protein